MCNSVEVLDLTKPIAEQLAGKYVICRSEYEVDRLFELSGLRNNNSGYYSSMVSYAERGFLYVSFKDSFSANDRLFNYGGANIFNDYCEGKEIKIPLPSIESRILAEKVSDRGVTVDVEFYRSESMDAKMKEALEYMDGSNNEVSATSILSAAKAHLDERARIYDRPQGERSIKSVVEAFNALTGDGLMSTEERGWMFMVLLKLSRSQQGSFKLDNYEDGTNYFALMGESAANTHNEAMARETTMPDMIK